MIASAVYEGTIWAYEAQPTGATGVTQAITARLGSDGGSSGGSFDVGETVWLWWPRNAAHLMGRA